MQSRPLALMALAAAACSSTASGAPPSWRRAVLVELYTSQGCSSCPPADAFVRELPALGLGRDKVIPLTFHVDYWDRLGWKDPFANPEFTNRQRWYARSGRLRSPDGPGGLDGLYTPQMIVDGTIQLSGQRRQTAMREMERAAARDPTFDLAVQGSIRGSTVDITAEFTERSGVKPDLDWRALGALAVKKARTSVAHGENAGETLDEAAVVRALSDRVPIARGGSSVIIRLGKPPSLSWSDVEIVVLAQSETTRESGAVHLLDPRQLATR